MNIFIIVFLVFHETAALVCQDGQRVVALPKGDLICVNCTTCPPGFGATVQCGSNVSYNVSVTCQACLPGKYSDSLSSESCKHCSKCLSDEAIVAECTNISDRRCSCKPCAKGYYRDKLLSTCLPCSGCCLDGMDEIASQCVSQKIPRTQTCSYQKRKPCGSKCWYDEITVMKHDGNYSCKPCPVCSKEHGLTVPCGGVVDEEVFIGCESPSLGKTFVNKQGVLQSCGTCSPGQEVVVNCSYKSDTFCGGCKQGYFYNYYSKSCQECFWCCSHSDSREIMKCIRKGMLIAERNELFLIRQLSLQLNTQPGQHYQTYSPMSLLNLDGFTLTVGFILLVFFYLFLNSKRKDSRNNVFNDEDAQDAIPDTKQVESEYPVQQNPGHAVFEKTGVEVIALGKTKSTTQPLPSDLALQATPNSAKPGFLEEGEIPLSPVIAFNLANKLDKALEVQIPHGANMVLSRAKWNVVLKERLNNRWVAVSQSGILEGQGIKNFVPKSNHVSFETDHLSTFAVVGTVSNHSLPAFKRMKVAAFCSETSIGEGLVVRLYCFDDCEYSFERLMRKEQDVGGKLISPIESLDFSVSSEKDVEIAVKDIDGWQIDEASSMKLGNNLLRNSFDITPQCDLVFHPTTKPGKSSFFAVVALAHEPSSQTVMYASTAIKKNPARPRIQNHLNEVHRDDGMSRKAGVPVETKQVGSDKCIIQM